MPTSPEFDERVARATARRHATLAADVLQLRGDAGITRASLAAAAGVDPAYLGRIESGHERPSVETYQRLALALGADLSTKLYPNTGPAIRDRHQATMLELLLQVTHPRWQRFTEVAVRRPSRGWIDAVLHDASARLAVASEIQSELRRLEQVVRWSGEKAASLPSWEGWPYLARTRRSRAFWWSAGRARPGRSPARSTASSVSPTPPIPMMHSLRSPAPHHGPDHRWCGRSWRADAAGSPQVDDVRAGVDDPRRPVPTRSPRTGRDRRWHGTASPYHGWLPRNPAPVGCGRWTLGRVAPRRNGLARTRSPARWASGR
jgi:transcriptional regulator with XRE-family HTH domain